MHQKEMWQDIIHFEHLVLLKNSFADGEAKLLGSSLLAQNKSRIQSQVSCGQWNILSLKAGGEGWGWNVKDTLLQLEIPQRPQKKNYILNYIFVSSLNSSSCEHTSTYSSHHTFFLPFIKCSWTGKFFTFWTTSTSNRVNWLSADSVLPALSILQSSVSASLRVVCAVIKLLATVKLMKLSTPATPNKPCQQAGAYPCMAFFFPPNTKSFQSL